MNLTVIQNGFVYTPDYIGKKDILIGGGKILAIDDCISLSSEVCDTFDAVGKLVLPGLIDQHIHLTGAGGKHSFKSMTPEVAIHDLVACGSTTVVGLLGTDGSTRSLPGLYAKVKSLEQQGLNSYMFTNYYGLPPITLTDSVKNDLIFIDKIIGCKIAISDIRSSFPTADELLKLISQIIVGGLISGKGGILHVHLGNLDSGMDILFELVERYQIPATAISPTHVGRSKALFEQALQFSKLGGIIDITTGASKFDEPYKQVLMALDSGTNINNMCFSSDGNAGISRINESGKEILYSAPVDQNLQQVKLLVQEGGLPIEDAFKLITSNPAKNLSLHQKGNIKINCDADLCLFDEDLQLIDVMSGGKFLMRDKIILITNEV